MMGIDTLVGGATPSVCPGGACVAGTVGMIGICTLVGRATPSVCPGGATCAGYGTRTLMPVKTALSLLPTGATCAGGGTKTVTRAVVKPGVPAAPLPGPLQSGPGPGAGFPENGTEPAGRFLAPAGRFAGLCVFAPGSAPVWPAGVN